MLVVVRDITDRKRAEDELVRSEERLRIIYENAPDAYYLTDLKGEFIDGNAAVEEMIGYAKDELIGKSFLDVGMLQKRDIPRAAKLLGRNVVGQATGPDVFNLRRRDEDLVSVEISTYPVKIENQTLVLGMARDITQRIKAEAEPVRIDVTLFDDVISRHDHIFDIVCSIGFVEGECEFEPSTT